MANFKLLILAAAAAFFTSSANAGYAQLSPPAGFSGTPGAWRYAAANASQFISNTVRTAASLSVGGVAVTVPVALRLAANASTYAARFAFANPLLITAAAATALAAAYIYWDPDLQTWVEDAPQKIDVVTYYKVDRIENWYTSPEIACYMSAQMLGGFVDSISNGRCYIKYPFPGQSWPAISEEMIRTKTEEKVFDVPKRIFTEPEFIESVSPKISPSNLPDWLPETSPIPVADPVINPSSDPIPLARPYYYPIGEPVPVPNTNPQQYQQPYIRIVPAPLSTDPWRVDVQPFTRTSTSTDPVDLNSDSAPIEQASPDSKFDLCASYPDILACAKPNFDTPATDQIQTKDIPINLTPDSGWGAENASCPAPRHLSGANVDFDFTLMCQFMTGIRPVIIAIAWLSAAMILIGFKRGE